jgi:hypothetical protein
MFSSRIHPVVLFVDLDCLVELHDLPPVLVVGWERFQDHSMLHFHCRRSVSPVQAGRPTVRIEISCRSDGQFRSLRTGDAGRLNDEKGPKLSEQFKTDR